LKLNPIPPGPGCEIAQIDHIFKVPCGYEWNQYEEANGVKAGCFTIAFNLTQCQEGKVVQKIDIKLRDQDASCRNDSTYLTRPKDTLTLYDTVIVDKDTTITSRDSIDRDTTGVFSTGPNGNGSTMTFDLRDPTITTGGQLPPGPPCQSRSFEFEVCDLWKWGHGPAEFDCPTVFEIILYNSDGSTCGIIPFVIWGSCNFPPDPRIEGGEGGRMPTQSGLYIPDVGELEMHLIRYENGRVIELK